MPPAITGQAFCLRLHPAILSRTHRLASPACSQQGDQSSQAKAGKLLTHPGDWLPPSLLVSALDRTDEARTWSLDIAESTSKRSPRRKEANGRLTCVMEDGTTFVGRFTLAGGRVRSGTVETR